MEQWNGFKYGPLRVEDGEECTVRCVDNNVYRLGKAEFALLLRLMTCYGKPVSGDVLAQGLSGEGVLRVVTCRLRKFLRDNLGKSIRIDTRHGFGYKLSIPNED